MLNTRLVRERVFENLLILIFSIFYYIPVSNIPELPSLNSFYFSVFGNSAFPSSLESLTLLFLTPFHVRLSVYYVLLAIISLYLSIIGVQLFFKNTIKVVFSKSIISGKCVKIASFLGALFVVLNPFFSNEYSLGIGYLPLLAISLGLLSSIFISKDNYKSIGLVFALSLTIVFMYYGSLVLIAYFLFIFILILPVYFRKTTLKNLLVFPIVSFGIGVVVILFTNFNFLLPSVFNSGKSSILYSLFLPPPINLYHEMVLDMNTPNNILAISGINFNRSFNSLWMTIFYAISVIIILIMSFVLSIITAKKGNLKPTIIVACFISILFLNLSFFKGYSLIETIPIYLVSHHIVNYANYGSLLSIFDENRVILFPFWYFIGMLFSIDVAFSLFETRKIITSSSIEKHTENLRESSRTPFNPKKRLISLNSMLAILVIILLMFVYLSTSIGGYSQPYVDKNSGTYAYVNSNMGQYNKILFYQNTQNFNPGNIYPADLQTQATIPNFPTYEDFANLASSPLVNAALRDYPPSSFIYKNGSNGWIDNYTVLGSSYKEIMNVKNNATIGTPVFVMGTENTFNKFIFSHNYYKQQQLTISENSQSMLNYSTAKYYSLPSNFLEYLNDSNTALSIQFNFSLKKDVPTFGGYQFGLSTNNSYWSFSNNSLPKFGIGSFNESRAQTYFGTNTPLDSTNYQEYVGLDPPGSFQNTLFNGWVPITGEGTSFVTILLTHPMNSDLIYAFADINGIWYSSPINYSIGSLQYVFSYAFQTSFNNISYSVNVTELRPITNSQSYIPIFYDSLFGNTTNLEKAITKSGIVLKSSSFNYTDLLGALAMQQNSNLKLMPGAYSVGSPYKKGWFQTFMSNAPQSGLYNTVIPITDLPLQYGFSSYYALAESVTSNSSLSIPAKHNPSESGYLLLNTLFSPMGGTLDVTFGASVFHVNTKEQNPHYGWVLLKSNSTYNEVNLTNLGGVQSVNQIIISNYSELKNNSIEAMHLLSLAGSTHSLEFVGQIINSEFHFSPTEYSLSISPENSNAFAVEFPNFGDFSYGSSASNGSVLMIPAWGGVPYFTYIQLFRSENLHKLWRIRRKLFLIISNFHHSSRDLVSIHAWIR